MTRLAPGIYNVVNRNSSSIGDHNGEVFSDNIRYLILGVSNVVMVVRDNLYWDPDKYITAEGVDNRNVHILRIGTFEDVINAGAWAA